MPSCPLSVFTLAPVCFTLDPICFAYAPCLFHLGPLSASFGPFLFHSCPCLFHLGPLSVSPWALVCFTLGPGLFHLGICAASSVCFALSAVCFLATVNFIIALFVYVSFCVVHLCRYLFHLSSLGVSPLTRLCNFRHVGRLAIILRACPLLAPCMIERASWPTYREAVIKVPASAFDVRSAAIAGPLLTTHDKSHV